MKDLTTTLDTNAAAAQSGWTEVYDIYLREAITTPWGTTATLRLTPCPGGFAFFTPKLAPEPVATQGDAATYAVWPIARARAMGESKISGQKMQITASNVTKEWAEMLQAVDWFGARMMIRKVPLNVSGLTADDCAVLWSGSIESCSASETQIMLTGGARSADLNLIAPRQNMHQACRFNWADDYCTAIRYAAKNYKAKTCSTNSTTTRVYSGDLTEDGGTEGAYGTDLVDARYGLGAFAQSSYSPGYNLAVTYMTDGFTAGYFRYLGYAALTLNFPITFTATVFPGGISAATTYYVRDFWIPSWAPYQTLFKVAAVPNGSAVSVSSPGSGVTATSGNDKIAEHVCARGTDLWQINGVTDWGTSPYGYYLITDAQAGLYNGALKPWMDVDFGAAKTPRVWRVKVPAGTPAEKCLRMLSIFGSADRTNWTHVSFMELPPVPGTFIDLLVPDSPSYRYWRICCRSRWGEVPSNIMIHKLEAYEEARNYWAWGRITFDADTATAALRGISRRVLASYHFGASHGVIHCAPLPAAPASGDTFQVERGCRRTFNACCEKGNWENFGGFLDLPYQTIIR